MCACMMVCTCVCDRNSIHLYSNHHPHSLHTHSYKSHSYTSHSYTQTIYTHKLFTHSVTLTLKGLLDLEGNLASTLVHLVKRDQNATNMLDTSTSAQEAMLKYV